MTMVVRDSNEKIGIQLFMNYCWGHPKSTMLFFPAGAVVGYINHAPSKDKVNAKMIWSEHAENRLDVLEEEIDGFLDVGSLVVEIVATREIKEGEESKFYAWRFILLRLVLVIILRILKYFKSVPCSVCDDL